MYPSTIYRVVAKALITNHEDKVLVVKEGQDFWSLPGGGLEHGEAAQDCLQREIQEEIGIDGAMIGDLLHSTTAHLDQKDLWMTWLVYRATINSSNFTLGDGVTDAQFIDIANIASSEHVIEKLIVETVHATRRD